VVQPLSELSGGALALQNLLVYASAHSINQWLFLFKCKLFRDIVKFIVVVEQQCLQVKSFCRRQQYLQLVVEERILDKLLWLAEEANLHYHSHHLADLVVYEALTVQSEAHPDRSTLPLLFKDSLSWELLASHSQYVSLG